MAIKLHVFMIKLDSNHTYLAVIILDNALMKDGNYYPQVFLKERKYIEKKVVKHIYDNFSDFSSSDEPDEEQNKVIRLTIFWKNTFEGAIRV